MSVEASGMDATSQGRCMERLEQKPRRESGTPTLGVRIRYRRQEKGQKEEQLKGAQKSTVSQTPKGKQFQNMWGSQQSEKG